MIHNIKHTFFASFVLADISSVLYKRSIHGFEYSCISRLKKNSKFIKKPNF